MNEEPLNDLKESAWPESAFIIRMMPDGRILPMLEWGDPDTKPGFLVYHSRTHAIVLTDGIDKYWNVVFTQEVLGDCKRPPWAAFLYEGQINVSDLYASRAAEVVKTALSEMRHAFTY